MKKRVAFICICAAAISMMGCGGSKEQAQDTPMQEEAAAVETTEAAEVTEETEAEPEPAETEAEAETAATETEETAEEAASVDQTEETAGSEEEATASESSEGADASTLPQYEYPGPESFYSVMYNYIRDELGSQYPEAEVTIPCPVIVYEDSANNQSIDVYGDFWVFNYNLEGDILECASGGSYPGVMHFKSVDTAEGYEVTGFDVIEDGENSNESAREIFGEHFDDYMKIASDSDTREELRAQIIANYVFDKGLSVTAYQDFGWDPVSLPEENIDSFYSQLD